MDALAGIYARRLPTLDRHVQLGMAGEKLVHLSFPETPDEDATTDHELLDRVAAYVAGEREDDFADVDVGLTVPTDHRRVLEALRQVPYGDRADVELLARMATGLDHDSEAGRATVRTALSENPVPIVFPDHRVDGVDGATPGEVRAELRRLEGLSG